MSDPVKPTKFKLRLRENAGPHVEAGPDPKTEILVLPGEVFEAPADRSQRWPEKFERMPDQMPVTARFRQTGVPSPPLPTPVPTPPPGKNPLQRAAEAGALEAMTPAELAKWAASEEIDVGKAKTRDEMLKVIKAALAAG